MLSVGDSQVDRTTSVRVSWILEFFMWQSGIPGPGQFRVGALRVSSAMLSRLDSPSLAGPFTATESLNLSKASYLGGTSLRYAKSTGYENFGPRTATYLKHECFTQSIPLGLCDAVHVVDQLDVATSLCDIASREHTLLRADHNFGWQAGDLSE